MEKLTIINSEKKISSDTTFYCKNLAVTDNNTIFAEKYNLYE